MAQEAVAWAIPHTRAWREDMRADLNNRLRVFCDSIDGLEGWSVGNAGGYYAWVQHPFEDQGSADVVKAMVEQCGVSALPGVSDEIMKLTLIRTDWFCSFVFSPFLLLKTVPLVEDGCASRCPTLMSTPSSKLHRD